MTGKDGRPESGARRPQGRPRAAVQKVNCTVHMPVDLVDRLARMSLAEGVSMSELVRRLLVSALPKDQPD